MANSGDGNSASATEVTSWSAYSTSMAILAGLNIFLAITASLGNALILIALHKVTSIYPRTKLLFRCLAVTDLLVGLNTQPISWPEIPDKMAEFEPAQRYAAFSIIIEKQTWRNPWRAKSVHFQSTTHSCILSLRLFYTTPHSRNLGGNCTTSRESLSVERQDM